MLVSADKERVGRCWPIVPGEVSRVVGRAPEAEGITLDDGRLSRKHVAIAVSSEGCVRIQDLQSSNGTQVNRVWLQEPLDSWSDVLIRIGDSVLHVGYVFPNEGLPNDGNDPALDHVARSHAAGTVPLGIMAEPGSGAKTLVRSIHRRSRREGGLVFLSLERWQAVTDVSGLGCPPGGTAVLMDAHRGDVNALNALCEDASRHDVRLLFQTPSEWGALKDVLDDERRIVLDRFTHRKAAAWGLTQHWLAEALGESVPPFRPSACVAWLSIPLNEGLHSLRERTVQLASVVRSVDWVRVEHFQEPWAEAESAEGRRNMERPSKETLVRLLEEHPSIQALADHLGRNRRQVYRWIDRHGLRSSSTQGDEVGEP